MATKTFTLNIELTGDAVDDLDPLDVVSLVWNQMAGDLDDGVNALVCTNVEMDVRGWNLRVLPPASPDAVDTDTDGYIRPTDGYARPTN